MTRVLVVGVGGQGVLTTARVLGEAAFATGLDATVGQLHGMSQRGGSVEGTVVFGGRDTSFVGRGQADVVLGLEPLEVLRARDRMHGATLVLTSTAPIRPPTLASDPGAYPPVADLLAEIRRVTPRVVALDGQALAMRAGDRRAVNAALLGALSRTRSLPFGRDTLLAAIGRHGRRGHHDIDRRAFELGEEAVAA